jgi:hypothetical protein
MCLEVDVCDLHRQDAEDTIHAEIIELNNGSLGHKWNFGFGIVGIVIFAWGVVNMVLRILRKQGIVKAKKEPQFEEKLGIAVGI